MKQFFLFYNINIEVKQDLVSLIKYNKTKVFHFSRLYKAFIFSLLDLFSLSKLYLLFKIT